MKPVEIIARLESYGFTAIYVGGMVRDLLMGIEPNDIDLATNATPEEIKSVFSDADVSFVGENFGVSIVDGIEVAMFRSETYRVAGKPDVVQVKHFYEDAKRRDFTINSMGKSLDGHIVDYFGGREDIKNKLIRAVGNPLERFEEDPSRILRAIYFAARFDFEIESNTLIEMVENHQLLEKVPQELIGKIVKKVIHCNCLSRFLSILGKTGLLGYVFPELAHTVDLKQNPEYHHLDVFGHTVAVTEATEKEYPHSEVLQLAAALHDNAKGKDGIRGTNSRGMPNDLGHEEAGKQPAYDACIRLGFGKDIANAVAFIVKHHGLRLPKKPKVRSVNKVIKRMISYMHHRQQLDIHLGYVFAFMHMDAQGFAPEFRERYIPELCEMEANFMKIANSRIFFPHELPINGKYLMEKGITGRAIGETMEKFIEWNFKTKEEVDAYFERREQE